MYPISRISQPYMATAIYERQAMPTPLMLGFVSSLLLCAAIPSDNRSMLYHQWTGSLHQHHALQYASSDLENGALALDPIKHTRVINRNILLCNSLDDLL